MSFMERAVEAGRFRGLGERTYLFLLGFMIASWGFAPDTRRISSVWASCVRLQLAYLI